MHTDTKTKDNVTVGVVTAVMFKVNPEMCKEAFYKVQNVQQQISAFVVRPVPASVDLSMPFVLSPSIGFHTSFPA